MLQSAAWEDAMRMSALLLAFLASMTLHAQPASFQRGDLVRVKPATDGSGVTTALTLRIVAIAGDRIRLDDAGIYVNEGRVNGFSADFVKRVAEAPDRTPQIVPAGHCFVMGEQRTTQDVSEYWGQHSVLSLVRAQ